MVTISEMGRIIEKCQRIHYLRSDKPNHQVVQFYQKGERLSADEIDLILNFIRENLPSTKPENVTKVDVDGSDHVVINISQANPGELAELKKKLPSK